MTKRSFPTQSELELHADKFWSYVDRTGECWLWLRAKDGKGYGAMGVRGRTLQAHKIAYVLTNGDVEPGLSVRHSCDTPACCNPAHLIAGTHKQNMEDMAARGRVGTRHGHENPNAKLTLEQAEELIQRHASGAKIMHLSSEFGVSCPVVRKIVRGEAYKSARRPVAS